jgi:tropomodulin
MPLDPVWLNRKIKMLQRSQVLGNKIEMEITQLIEKNTTLLRLGLHLEYNDARHRIASHLQRNIDTSKS